MELMSSTVERTPEADAEAPPAWWAARHRRMLRAAIAALRKEGSDDVSMDDVARAAGVGKATLYRYFHTKEGLLRACLEDVVEELSARMEETESSDAPPLERLRRILGLMVDAFSQDLLPLRLLTRRGDKLDAEWRRSIQDARHRLVTVLDRHFRRGAEEGVYRELDLALVPHLIVGMIRSGVTHTGLSNRAVADGIHHYVLRASLVADGGRETAR